MEVAGPLGALMGVEGPQKKGLFRLHMGTQVGLGLRRGKAGLSLGWEDPLEEGMATHSSLLPG